MRSGAAIKTVKEQLRQLPHRGMSYGILRYLQQDPSLQQMPQVQVAFNYLGQFEPTQIAGLIQGEAPEALGLLDSPHMQHPYLIVINGVVTNQQLQLDWLYHTNMHYRATIEHLANRYLTHLAAPIDHCLAADAGGFTPSDFPEAALSQDELDQLLAELG